MSEKVSLFSESTLQVLNMAGETSKENLLPGSSPRGQQINAYFSTKPRNRLLICLGQLIFSFILFSFSLFHHKKDTKQKQRTRIQEFTEEMW